MDQISTSGVATSTSVNTNTSSIPSANLSFPSGSNYSVNTSGSSIGSIGVTGTDLNATSFGNISGVSASNISINNHLPDIISHVITPPTDLSLSHNVLADKAQAGTVLGTLTGTDQEESAQLGYSLLDDAGGKFVVNSTTGVISVNDGANIDFNSATNLNITARVTDQWGKSFDKSFAVNISGPNHAPTGLVLTGGVVAENSAAGTVVGTLAGVDNDQGAGATLQYSLLNNGGGRFVVNATSGEISVAQGAVLNFEKKPIVKIIAQVTDQGGLSYKKAMYINLTNVNEAPVSLKLTNAVIAENTQAGTVVGRLYGKDKDAGSVLTYSLLDNAGGRFVVDATTGDITVAAGAVLDYEASRTHLITARVTDEGGLFYDRQFLIRLRNVNEAPVDLTLSNTVIDENSAAWTVVGSMRGIDYDAHSRLTYSLVNNADGRFVIDGRTGVVRVNAGALLDAKLTPTLNITGRVTDQGGLSYDKDFTITLDTVLVGNNKRNAIVGLSSDNVIIGGKGNDTLTGGAGSDTFVFHQGDGRDVITDFTAKGTDHDIIQLDPAMVADWSHLLAKTTQSGANVIISTSSSDRITLNNVALSSLTEDNFRFQT